MLCWFEVDAKMHYLIYEHNFKSRKHWDLSIPIDILRCFGTRQVCVYSKVKATGEAKGGYNLAPPEMACDQEEEETGYQLRRVGPQATCPDVNDIMKYEVLIKCDKIWTLTYLFIFLKLNF